VQLPLVAGFIGSVPIVNPVGRVAILLDFRNQQPIQYGVDCPAGNIYKIAGLHHHLFEELRNPAFLDCLYKFTFPDIFQSVNQFRIPGGADDIPHLILATSAIQSGIGVVRMHLHGKPFIGVDELIKQGKSIAIFFINLGAQNLILKPANQFQQCFPLEFSVFNHAHAVFPAAEFPAFAYFLFCYFSLEICAYLISAPQHFFIYRLEFQRVGHKAQSGIFDHLLHMVRV
jgi:hypothetical protein